MQNEVTAAIQILSQSLMMINNVSKGMVRFLILSDRYLKPHLERALNTGNARTHGQVSLKELEKLRGKNLAIIPMSKTMQEELRKECKNLNVVFHSRKENNTTLQQQIKEKENELIQALEHGQQEQSEATKLELEKLKQEEKWIVFIDASDTNKIKHFLSKYEIEIKDVKPIEEVLSEEEIALYEKLDVKKEEIELLRKQPISPAQEYVLKNEPSALSSGHHRIVERQNIFIPKNKLEATEVIGYLYGRIDVVPNVERTVAPEIQPTEILMVDSDGDGYTDREELAVGSDPHDYHSTPNNFNQTVIIDEVHEKIEKLEKMKDGNLMYGKQLEITATIKEAKELLQNNNIEHLTKMNKTLDTLIHKISESLPKMKV